LLRGGSLALNASPDARNAPVHRAPRVAAFTVISLRSGFSGSRATARPMDAADAP